MNLFDIFFILPIGFLYPSFNLYLKVAKKIPFDRELIHFIVFSFYLTIIQIFDYFISGIFLFTLIKLILIIFMIFGEYSGSFFIFHKFIAPFFSLSPFLIDFADSTHQSSISDSFLRLFSYFTKSFVSRYNRALIDIKE